MKWLRRILLALLALPVVLVTVLGLVGLRPNAGRNVSHVEIACSPQEVYRWFSDVERLKSWTGFTEVEGIGPEGFEVGRPIRISSVTSRGRRTELKGGVTNVKRNQQLAFTLRDAEAGWTQSVSYDFEGLDDRTRVTCTLEMEYEGLLVRLLEPLITRSAQPRLEALLQRLRTASESSGSEGCSPATPKSPR